MRVLVTYFAPFGTDTENASALAVRLLPEEFPGAELRKIQLPVAFQEAEQVLENAIREFSPDLVLCTGQAEGAAELRLERVATNLRDARMPDNRGFAPEETPVYAGGPAACFAAIPVKQLAKRLRESGIPAAVSCSAGTYVCNDVMYTLLRLLSQLPGNPMGGFVHVPLTPQQAAGRAASVPSMASETAAEGLTVMIRALTR